MTSSLLSSVAHQRKAATFITRPRWTIIIVIAVFLFAACDWVVAKEIPGKKNAPPRLGIQLGHSWSVVTACFSPDGRKILTASEDNTARLWDIATGREVRQFNIKGKYSTFAPDGRSVLVFGVEGKPSMLDVATGQELRQFGQRGDGERSADFSPDGRMILTTEREDSVRLWDVATGREVHSFKGLGNYGPAAVFSPDGRIILTVGWGLAPVLWDAITGRQIRRFALLDPERRVESAVFSPDGHTILTASIDHIVRLWDVATGLEVHQFAVEDNYPVYSAVFSPDGRTILTASGDHIVRLWDVARGQEVRQFAGHGGKVNSAVFSPDGRTILTAGTDHRVRLWDVATGRELHHFGESAVFQDGREFVESATFSQDGRNVLTTGGDYSVQLWDASTGREIRRFELHAGPVASAVFSPDGRTILTASYDGTARLWDVATSREIYRFEYRNEYHSEHAVSVRSAVFSPDGRTILSVHGVFMGERGAVCLWDVETRRQMRCVERDTGPGIFSPDGGTILLGGCLWDASMGLEIRCTDELSRGVFSPDGRTILAPSWDKTARLWDVATGKELARLISFTDGTWAVIDDEGRFDSARAGDVAGLHWVVGLEPISLSQLKDRYYEPGLLAKKLGFNPEPLRPVTAFTAPALYPDITLNQPNTADPVLRIALTNRGGGIGRVVVAINGKEMSADARPRGANPEAQSLTLEIPLASYQNWLKDKNSIQVTAYNTEGYLASRAAEVLYEPARTTTRSDIILWAIVVGVSDYAGGEQIDLRYAAKDAADIAKAIGLGGRRLFGADHVHVTTLTTDQTDEKGRPTKANIQTAFKALTTAKPDDVLFIYFAGHGVAVQDVYYFPTQEAHTTNLDDPEVRKQRAVSSEEIVQWLKESPATQRQVLILDTCAAGAAARSLVEQRTVSSDQIRALDRLKDRTGVHVLMGSAADRVSYEATQFEQGLLTHALLRGMKGAALREEAYVDVTRLFNYVADEVPQLAAHIGGIQRPHIAAPRAVNIESFDIGRLTGDDRQAIPLRSPKPLLLRPTLLNEQVAYDDLGLETKLRGRLREKSFARVRGSEMALVFVEADELPGAIKPSGLYSVSGSLLRAKIILRRDNRTKELQVEGTRVDLDGFIEKAVQAVTRAVDGWK